MFYSTALEKDRNDALAFIRNKFLIPEECTYFDGNSLGALPKNVKDYARDVVEKQWGEDLIRSWNDHDWINLPVQTGEKIAPLIGAASRQVISCDSISINIFKLLSTVLEMQKKRKKSSQSHSFGAR